MVEARTQRLNELAADIGRLRSRYPSDHIVDRAAGHVESLVLMLEPSAAQIAAWNYPGDEDTIVEAIRIRDERMRHLSSLLGKAT